MFIRGRFCWTSLDKNELMSLLARMRAWFFSTQTVQHGKGEGEGRGGNEGREVRRRRALFAINWANENM